MYPFLSGTGERGWPERPKKKIASSPRHERDIKVDGRKDAIWIGGCEGWTTWVYMQPEACFSKYSPAKAGEVRTPLSHVRIGTFRRNKCTSEARKEIKGAGPMWNQKQPESH